MFFILNFYCMIYTNNDYKQKESAWFKHVMFLKSPLGKKDSRTIIDGYAHATNKDYADWEKGNIKDLATKKRKILERHLCKKVYQFRDGGFDRNGNPTRKYPIQKFEVWVINREIGEDKHLCTLVENSLGKFVPHEELGGFINADKDLEVYREWVLEIFYPQFSKKEAWCLNKATLTQQRFRAVMGQMLPPTFEEFFALMNTFVEGVYQDVYMHKDSVAGAKRDMVNEATKQMHSYWETAKEVDKTGYNNENASLAFINLFHKHICKGI